MVVVDGPALEAPSIKNSNCDPAMFDVPVKVISSPTQYVLLNAVELIETLGKGSTTTVMRFESAKQPPVTWS